MDHQVRRPAKVVPPKTTLAQRLSTARKTAGLSMGALARAAKVETMTVSKIEAGIQADMQTATLFALADALDINARWLATGHGTPVKWQNVSPDEAMLLEHFRAMDDARQHQLLELAAALPKRPK